VEVAVSLSRDDEPDPETDDAALAPAALDHSEGGSLERDVDEVERGNPERAFDVGVTVGIVVTVAAVIFVLQNRQSTTFDWLWLDFELPLWIALLGAVGVGVVLMLTIVAVHARRRRRVRRRRDAAGRLRRAVARRRPPAETGP
jgi:uncharacterized integral membrane protein